MQFRALGPLQVRNNAETVELQPQQRRLIAALLVEPNMVVSVDRLLERTYGDDQPSGGHKTLHTAMSRLRSKLGEGEIVTEPSGYQLVVGVDDFDAICFERLVGEADAPGLNVHQRLARLDEALALWRGPAFEDVSGKDWAHAEADRLNELRVTAAERRYDAMLNAGMHTDALPGLGAEVEAHPLRDRLVGLRMLALFRSGRQAEATRVFQEHRRRLAEQFGLDPGADLVELDRRVVAGDESLRLESTPGRALRGYRLGEQLGEGAFAVVYRGTQPSVGRDVAVKVIRAELANRPDFVRRFEAEAHMVARLEHPFIVPLYDYWREPDRACLVFRYLRGGTLEARITATGGLAIDECRTMVKEVGAALTAAHAAGVVHRDVKPANVLLDESGNFYLGDFGIALDAIEERGGAADLSVGSPAYASPEQLRREPIGPSADVHGLGISIYESLSGQLPFPAAITQAALLQRQLHDPIPPLRERRSDVPVAVDAVLARATAKDPAARYQTIDELVAEFSAALDGPSAPVVRAGKSTSIVRGEERNPYKGLRAFTEADSGDFYGREHLVDRLIDVLGRSGPPGRIAAVVGPSGIGKSSVVRAGLLPALRHGAVVRSDHWFVATMMPGRDPFDELSSALLRVATRVPDNMMSVLTHDHRGIARVVKALVPEDDLADVLLVIDQFEELFTLVDDVNITRLFLDALEHAVTDARCPLRVVLTVRADFWDRPLRHGSFARLIEESTINVTALAPDELERAIVEPAHRAGAVFEPGLVSEIVADVTDQPGALPLLQYALTELWERAVSGLLTKEAYRELGGVAGALTRRAEQLYQEANTDEQRTIRRVFGGLVTLGEGSDDTRRRVRRAELVHSEHGEQVIGRYGDARLLSFDTDPSTREPTVEVAHEALLRQWPRLRQWLDEDRDDIRIQRHLQSAAADWVSSGRVDSELYRGGRLETAEQWAEEQGDELGEIEGEFLAAGMDRRAERQDAELRTNRRLRRLLTGVGVIAAVAVLATLLALQQRSRAEDQAQRARDREAEALDAQAVAEDLRNQADLRRMTGEAALLAKENPSLAMLLAAAAFERAPAAQTLGGLQRTLTRTDGLLGYIGTGTAYTELRFVEDRTLIARSSIGLEVWDVEERTLLLSVDLGGSGPLATVPGQRTIAVSLPNGVVQAIDIDSGATVASSPPGTQVTALAMTDAGGSIAIGRLDGALSIADTSSLTPRLSLQLEGVIEQVLFAPDGRSIVVADGSSALARRIDVATGAEIWAVDKNTRYGTGGFGSEGSAAVTSLRMDSTGELILESSVLGAITYELDTGRPRELLSREPNNVSVIDFGSDRLLLGAAIVDRTTAETIRQLQTTKDVALSVDLSLDGRTAAVASLSSNSIAIWALDGRQLLADAVPLDISTQAYLNPTNDLVVGIHWPLGPFNIWNLSSGEPIIADLGDNPWMAAWTPGGSLVSYETTGETRAFDPDDFAPIGPPLEPMSWGGYATAPHRSIGVVGQISPAGGILIYDLRTGEVIAELLELADRARAQGVDPSFAFVGQIAFDPNGSLMIASTFDGAAALYRVAGWEFQRFLDLGASIANVTFSQDGDQLAVQTADGSIHRLDAQTLEPVAAPLIGPPGTTGFITDHPLAYGPSDKTLVVGLPQGAQLWDLESGQQIGGTFPNEALFAASPAFDGTKVITGFGEHLLIWDLDTDRWLEIACRAAGRNMTLDEWESFGPAGAAYEATCPQWPPAEA